MKKKSSIDQSMLTLAIIAIVILAGLGLFIFYATDTPLEQAKKDGMKDVYQVLTEERTSTDSADEAPIRDPKEIEASYKLELGTLLEELKKEERTVEQLFAHAQNKLLGMRVPQSMLDVHLKGVLALRSMQSDFENGAQIASTDIIGLVEELQSGLK